MRGPSPFLLVVSSPHALSLSEGQASYIRSLAAFIVKLLKLRTPAVAKFNKLETSKFVCLCDFVCVCVCVCVCVGVILCV